MKNKKWALPLLAAFFIILTAAGAAAQNKSDRVYKFALWTVGTEKQASTLNEFTKKIVKLMFTAMGERVEFIPMTRDEALKQVKAKKVDVLYLWQSDYLDVLNAGVEVHPILTVTTKGSHKDNLCLVTKKDFEFKTYEDLRGKTFPMPPNFWDYIAYRWYLASKKIDMPLNKFFGGFNSQAYDSTSALNLVAEGKIDAAFIIQQTLNFQKLANPGVLKKVKMNDCGERPWPSTPVVWVGRVPESFQKKFYDVLGRLDTIPEFQQLKPTLSLIKLQMDLVTDKDYEAIRKLYADAKAKGWIAEYNRLLKK